MEIDKHKTRASLLRKNGWILSRPGDLFSFKDNIFVLTISEVNLIIVICVPTRLLLIDGIMLLFSSVNTLEKYVFNVSAFSNSVTAFSLLGKVNVGMSNRVFNLDATYFQNGLGFVLTDVVICSSNCFLNLLVVLLNLSLLSLNLA